MRRERELHYDDRKISPYVMLLLYLPKKREVVKKCLFAVVLYCVMYHVKERERERAHSGLESAGKARRKLTRLLTVALLG